MKYLGEFLILAVYAGIVYTLVRPGSSGPGLVTATTGGLAQIVNAAEGGGKW